MCAVTVTERFPKPLGLADPKVAAKTTSYRPDTAVASARAPPPLESRWFDHLSGRPGHVTSTTCWHGPLPEDMLRLLATELVLSYGSGHDDASVSSREIIQAKYATQSWLRLLLTSQNLRRGLRFPCTGKQVWTARWPKFQSRVLPPNH